MPLLLAASGIDWSAITKALIVVIGGGGFVGMWFLVQKARSEWRTLAKEWSETDHFRDAVNKARLLPAQNLIHEMHGEIDARIDKHDRDPEAHQSARKHDVRNLQHIITGTDERSIRAADKEIARLERRIEALESRKQR